MAVGTETGTSNRGFAGSMICSRRTRKRISATVGDAVLPILAHLDVKPRVCLVTYVHLQGENVCGVVGLHLLHQRALLSQGCVLEGHQCVGRKVCRIEAPRDAASPRGRRGGGGGAGGRRDKATVPGLAQLPGHNHASFRVTIEPPALRDGTARVPEGRRGGVDPSRCGVRIWSFSRGRWWRSVRMLAGRPVEPEYGAEQPAGTQEQQQAADHQEAFVEGPRWPTQQQVGLLLLLLQLLKTQGNVINMQRAIGSQ